MINSYNKHISLLPKHLLQYVVDQDYAHYNPMDQAVWRYVMRQNVSYLPSVCHGSYLEGLEKTGLSIDHIPSMSGMNRILKDIGWYAVAVDGFIPPSVFMEFQANNVLVIAADIRQINHIGYTPAPDILHEAAGHAPIIADPKYAFYLKKFGEIGSKAFSSHHDIELFESIRKLSILKESPSTKKDIIQKAEDEVLKLQSKQHELSEMSKIRNLHWWTVEYGLIGPLNNPKIYGAGLLSSISESANCLKSNVKKIPYSILASDVTFDITTEQPQLFVAKDFDHINDVLDEYSQSMAFRIGGEYGIKLAVESKQIATCEYDSGVQVSGIFSDFITVNEQVVYLKTNGPTSLSYKNNEIENQGIHYHNQGFGCPIGEIENFKKTDFQDSIIGDTIYIKYKTGVELRGKLLSILRDNKGEPLVLTFNNCTVSLFNNEILFDPSWGNYDLVIGEKIVSAYPHPADYKSFPLDKVEFKSKTIHSKLSKDLTLLNSLYKEIRLMRESKLNAIRIDTILNILIKDFTTDWLLTLEICEITKEKKPTLYNKGLSHLKNLSIINVSYKKLILDGLKIL